MKVFFKHSKHPQGYLPKIAYHLARGNEPKVKYFTERQINEYGEVKPSHKEFVQLRKSHIQDAIELSRETYFDLFLDALHAAYDVTTYANGYEINEREWDEHAMDSVPPPIGENLTFSVGLYRNGRPIRQCLHVCIFGMKSGKYELNYYVS